MHVTDKPQRHEHAAQDAHLVFLFFLPFLVFALTCFLTTGLHIYVCNCYAYVCIVATSMGNACIDSISMSTVAVAPGLVVAGKRLPPDCARSLCNAISLAFACHMHACHMHAIASAAAGYAPQLRRMWHASDQQLTAA